MLLSVELTNVRSHRSTQIDFHSGMNVITGSSDSGKSAIVWGIIQGLTNKPSGEEHKSWDAKESDVMEVSFEFDNGWFSRRREKKKNMYICEEGKFEALRTDVPEVIQNIANIKDYNIQTQAKPYFMLPDSSGDRAKKLNELVGLNIIDQLFKKINKKVSDTKSDVTRLTGEVSSISEEIDQLSYLTSVATQIEKLDDDISQYVETSHRKDLIASLLIKLQEIDVEIDEQKKFLSLESDYLKLKELINKREIKLDKMQKFNSFISQITYINTNINYEKEVLVHEKTYLSLNEKIKLQQEGERRVGTLSRYLKSYKECILDLQADKEWLAVEEPYNALNEKINLHMVNKEKKSRLISLYESVESMNMKLLIENGILSGAMEIYINTLEEAKLCPTCNSPINTSIIKQIKTKLLAN